MASNSNNYGYSRTGGNNINGGNGSNSNVSPAETEELSAEDYEIIAAGFGVLGELFAFLALVKAKQVTKDTGGQIDVEPLLFVQSRKKTARRRSRLPRR